jgi:hypothetical protein
VGNNGRRRGRERYGRRRCFRRVYGAARFVSKRLDERVEFGEGLGALPPGDLDLVSQALELRERRLLVKRSGLRLVGHCWG